MKTYKELRDGLFEEISKIDVSKLTLSMVGGLKDYTELLKALAELPGEGRDEMYKQYSLCSNTTFNGFSVPKIEEEAEK